MWVTVVTAEIDLGYDGSYTSTVHVAESHEAAASWALANYDKLAASAIKESGDMTEENYTLYLVDVEVGATFPVNHLEERDHLDRVNRSVGSLALWNWDSKGEPKIISDKTPSL